jgi:Tol biopolymer transport system component
MDGGEARVLTTLKNGVSVFQWSPDGKRFVVVSQTGPSDNMMPSTRRSDVWHYSHMLYKFNDTGRFDDKRSHLWIIDAATGAGKQITSGEDWNDTDPQWSPDSTRIAFVSDRTGLEYDDGHNQDVWVIRAEGGPLAKISDHDFEDLQPR